MKYYFFILCALALNQAFAKTEPAALSLFQTQIKDCELVLGDLKNIKSFLSLYMDIQKKYLIISEKTLYRELYFQTKGERRKIKITNDALEIFKIDHDDRLTRLGVDVRHKMRNSEAQVNQLTLNSKIEKDWQKTLETRENGLKIEIVRVDQKITQIKILAEKMAGTLDCQVVNASEVCLCNK